MHAPRGFSESRIQKFLESRQTWLERHLIAVAQIEKNTLQRIALTPARSREEIREELFMRMETLAAGTPFSYKRLSLRRQSSRWASCSSSGTISLNAALVILPSHLIDYVLLHELVHTEVPNHSNVFWSNLDQYYPRSRNVDRELKSYAIPPLEIFNVGSS